MAAIYYFIYTFIGFLFVFHCEAQRAESPQLTRAATQCSFNPCLNGGLCALGGDNNYTCLCLPNYTGVVCDTEVITTDTNVTDQCSFNPCWNGGKCVENQDQYACVCPPGFSGAVCQVVITTTTTALPRCAFNPCFNGGYCVTNGDDYTCICPPTHGGLVCQTLQTTVKPRVCQIDKTQVGTTPAEVVFMMEVSSADRPGCAIDHEGDFIKKLLNQWNVDQASGIRFGLVIYTDTANEIFSINDFANDPQAIAARITQLTGSCSSSGNGQVTANGKADLANGLDLVRNISFTHARPSVPRVVIPIMHEMPTTTTELNKIITAGQELKDDCTAIVGITVTDGLSSLDFHTVETIVSQPYRDHLWEFRSFVDLENFVGFP